MKFSELQLTILFHYGLHDQIDKNPQLTFYELPTVYAK